TRAPRDSSSAAARSSTPGTTSASWARPARLLRSNAVARREFVRQHTHDELIVVAAAVVVLLAPHPLPHEAELLVDVDGAGVLGVDRQLHPVQVQVPERPAQHRPHGVRAVAAVAVLRTPDADADKRVAVSRLDLEQVDIADRAAVRNDHQGDRRRVGLADLALVLALALGERARRLIPVTKALEELAVDGLLGLPAGLHVLALPGAENHALSGDPGHQSVSPRSAAFRRIRSVSCCPCSIDVSL